MLTSSAIIFRGWESFKRFLAPTSMQVVLVMWTFILFTFPHVFVLPNSPCRSSSIASMSLPCVWIVVSSAYKSEEHFLIWSGRSLIKMRNKVGPNIEPWGTPDCTVVKSVNPLSLSITCCREHKYDLNHCMAEGLSLYNASLFSKMEWSTRSKAVRKSIKRAPTKSPLSIHFIQSLMSLTKAVWQLCFGLNPDGLSCRSLYLFKYAIRWLFTCFSKILDTVDRIEIGL